jgi:prepilin-type N-terminal cleavage/methylation domain-containing protein
MRSHQPRSGLSLVELLVVLVIVGILAAHAAPLLRQAVLAVRARSLLNRVTGELYRARMTAVESGGPVSVTFSRAADGCVDRARVAVLALPDPVPTAIVPLRAEGVCLRHTGDSVIVFNSRGMLRPPARSIHVSYGAASDSVLVSIAGRIRRSFRRARPAKLSARRQTFPPRQPVRFR